MPVSFQVPQLKVFCLEALNRVQTIVFDKTGGGDDYISPKGSEIYVDRSQNFPYKIDENDLCYKLFKEHGFTWGGDWNSCKDYQHFQKAQ